MSNAPNSKKDEKREDTASIARAPGMGMDPKSILIGDRLRHTVHNGALKMPMSVLALIAKHQVLPDEEGEAIKLPSVDSVIRPTLEFGPLTVTYLREEKGLMPVPPGQPEGTPQVAFTRTLAVNQLWNVPAVVPEINRLRGGGADGEDQVAASAAVPSARTTGVSASSDSADLAPADLVPAAPAPTAPTPTAPVLAVPTIAVPEPAAPSPAAIAPASIAPAAIAPEAIAPTAIAPTAIAPTAIAPAVPLPAAPSPAFPAPAVPAPAVPALAAPAPAAPAPAAPAPAVPAPAAPSPAAPSPTAPSPAVPAPAAPVPAALTPALLAPAVPAPAPSIPTPIATAPATQPAAPSAATPAPAAAVVDQQPLTHQTVPLKMIPSSSTTAPTAKPVVSAVSVSASPPTATTAPVVRPVVGLAKVPAAQYVQHIPGSNDEMQVEIKNTRPPWYSKERVSEIERTLLPEWFDKSAQHRSKESYIKAREHILNLSTQLGNRFITTALIRRTLPGDAGSLNRLHQLLMSYGLINADAINDSTPTTYALRDHKKRARTTQFQDKLSEVVLKKHKENPTIDWQSVADQVGDGATATDCQKGFLAINLGGNQPATASTLERSITPEPTEKAAEHSSAGCLKIEQLLANTDDKVLIPTVETALKQTEDLGQARSAAVTALLASQATEKARTEEEALGHVLAELNEKRMQRLEKRIELLNDVEGMMEAERMALELERRDLYTARCRHWFGGSS